MILRPPRTCGAARFPMVKPAINAAYPGRDPRKGAGVRAAPTSEFLPRRFVDQARTAEPPSSVCTKEKERSLSRAGPDLVAILGRPLLELRRNPHRPDRSCTSQPGCAFLA